MYDKHLNVFLTVANSGSFSKAAKKLKITPQAVLKQVQLLEEKLGVKLFLRTSSGVVLTGGGKSIFNDANYIISFANEARKRARYIEDGKVNLVRFGFSCLTSVDYLSNIWPLVLERYPRLKCEIVPFENDSLTVWQLLTHMGERIDVIAGAFDEDFLERRSCQALKLTEKPLKILLSVFHPLASKKVLSISDLEGYEILVSGDLWMRRYDAAKSFLSKNSKIKLSNYQSLEFSLLNECANSSTMILGLDVWANNHPLITAAALDWDRRLPYGIIFSKTPSIPVSRFIEMVFPAIKKLGFNPFSQI